MRDQPPRLAGRKPTRRAVLRTAGVTTLAGGGLGALASPAAAQNPHYVGKVDTRLSCSSDPLNSCLSVSGKVAGVGNTDRYARFSADVRVFQECVTSNDKHHHPPSQPQGAGEEVTAGARLTPENGKILFDFTICADDLPDEFTTPLDCSPGHDRRVVVTYDNPELCWDLDLSGDDLDANGEVIPENVECNSMVKRFGDETCSAVLDE